MQGYRHSVFDEADFKDENQARRFGIAWEFCCKLMVLSDTMANHAAKALGGDFFNVEWSYAADPLNDAEMQAIDARGAADAVEAPSPSRTCWGPSSGDTHTAKRCRPSCLRRTRAGSKRPHHRVRFENAPTEHVSLSPIRWTAPESSVCSFSIPQCEFNCVGPSSAGPACCVEPAWRVIGGPMVENPQQQLTCAEPCTDEHTHTYKWGRGKVISSKIVLVLDELVRESSEDRSVVVRAASRLNLGFDVDLNLSFGVRFSPCDLCQDLAQLGALHASTVAALLHLPFWDRRIPYRRVRLYTDGSYTADAQEAGWAVVMVVCTELGWQLAGYCCGSLELFSADCGLQQLQLHAYTAEVTAMLYALVLARGCQCEHVDVCFDCVSAAGAAAGRYWSACLDRLSCRAAQLAILAEDAGKVITWRHIKSHVGDSLNELADRAAKFGSKGNEVRVGENSIAEAIREDVYAWLWWVSFVRDHPQVLPCVNADGLTAPTETRVVVEGPSDKLPGACVKHDASHNVGAAVSDDLRGDKSLPSTPVPRLSSAEWCINLITYNTLSLKSVAQKECLCKQSSAHEIHVVGLQETRVEVEPLTRCGPYRVFASDACKGQDGCQIWINSEVAFGKDDMGKPIKWDPGSAAIWHADPRLLLVLTDIGRSGIAFCSGHAPTADAGVEAVHAWWDRLESIMRGIPRRYCPLCLFDCNARYRSKDEAGTVAKAEPLNVPAQRMRDFLTEACLTASNLKTSAGEDVVTWVSPVGRPACLGFVLLPDPLGGHAQTFGGLPHFTDVHGFDHAPLHVRVSWKDQVEESRRNVVFDRRAMLTAEGRQVMRDVFRSAPLLEWEETADAYLSKLNSHIKANLEHHCPLSRQRPRLQQASEQTWAVIRQRRHARRLLRRLRDLADSGLLDACWGAWRGETCRARAWLRRCKQLRFGRARVAVSIRRLTHTFRVMSAVDAANFVRRSVAEARTEGSAELASLLRGMLKFGRRYRPLQPAPILHDNGETYVGRGQVLPVLAQHFAVAERAVPCRVEELHQQQSDSVAVDVDASEMPDVAQRACCFSALKSAKAAGVSSIPAEAYKAAPYDAALTHMPLILRMVLRADCPVLWKGGRGCPVPKAGKALTDRTGWRNIICMEASQKAAGRAVRVHLMQNFKRMAHTAQCGSPKGLPLELPMTYIRSHVEQLHTKQKNGAVLFIDGKDAYYSALRQLLIDNGGFETAQEMQTFLEGLHADPEVQARFAALIWGPGLLTEAGVASGIKNFIRSTFEGSWMSLQPELGRFYLTTTGTVPGAPLADILFVFLGSLFLERLRSRLEERGLLVTSTSGFEGPAAGWADDFGVMLEADTPQLAVQQVQDAVPIVHSCLLSIGVSLNLQRGKTEALLVLKGHGSRQLKQQLFCSDDPSVPVVLSRGVQTAVCLTTEYTHLGGIVAADGHAMSDMKNRACAAEGVFKRLRKMLFWSMALQLCEKTHLLESLVLRKFLHGACF